MARRLRFAFDESKALEVLLLVASEWPGITPFYAAKVVFVADKSHLNRFGRPVVGDRYIAMDNGPVPSAIYDWIKGNLDRAANPQAIVDAITVDRNARYPRIYVSRGPDLDLLSPSDIRAIREAVAFCREHSVGALSRYTHDDPAWKAAGLNAEMDPALMIEGEGREEMVDAAREFAAYGVV